MDICQLLMAPVQDGTVTNIVRNRAMKDRWKKNTVQLAAGALAFGLGAAAPVTALAGPSPL